MSRLDSPYLGEDAGVLTTTDGTPGGATRGEMEIAPATTLPTTDVGVAQFEITGKDKSGDTLAAPRALSMGARLSGTGAATASLPFRLVFWHPQAARWYATSMYTALGDTLLDDETQGGDGNVYFSMCPRWALYGFVHAPNLPTGMKLHITVARDRQ